MKVQATLDGTFVTEMRELATGTLLRAVMLQWEGRDHQAVHFFRLAQHYVEQVEAHTTLEQRIAWALETRDFATELFGLRKVRP